MYLRNFSRVTARAALVAMALLSARARAAVPTLPDTAISDDTFLVVNMNAAALTPESVQAAATALLGPQAAVATDGIAKYKAKYDEYTAKGVEGVTMVMSGDPNGEKKPDPVVFVKLRPGSDHAALEKQMKEDQAKEGKTDAPDVSNEGDFMVMRTKGSAAAAGSPERSKIFQDILKGSSTAVSIAFLPTEKIRAKMKEDMNKDKSQPAWATAVFGPLSDSKWLVMDAKLGDTPTIGVSVEAADEAGAKGISDGVVAASQDLKTKADQMKAGGPQFAPMADSLGGIADALKPTQTGSKVSLSIDGKTVAPALANFLPFIMMGAGGGGAPPAPAPTPAPTTDK